MKDLTTTSFGLVIAYVLPGSAGLYALSLLITPFKNVGDRFFTANADVGLFLLVLAAAVVAGLQINVLRWALYEKFLFSDLKLSELSYGKLDGENKLKIVLYIIEENYRYHQFYGGMTIVMPLVYWAWVRTYHAKYVQNLPMRLIMVLFILSLTVALSFVLMKQRKNAKYIKKTGYKILIVAFIVAASLMLWGWLCVYPSLPRETRLFTLLTSSFVIMEVATGAAAYAARARYVNRATQIIQGA